MAKLEDITKFRRDTLNKLFTSPIAEGETRDMIRRCSELADKELLLIVANAILDFESRSYAAENN